MPLYEYRCRKCEAVFEEMAPMARADEMDCIVCGSGETERLVSSFCSSVSSSSSGGIPPCGMGG